MIQRTLHIDVLAQKSKYPVLAVTGARQSGKTTLMKEAFKDYTYLSLENPDIREYALQDTKGFLKEYNSFVIFDEAQRVPQLFSYLQDIVDRDKTMGRFILSGSQNFHLLHNITQSLSGRVALFTLFPFDIEEMKKVNILKENLSEQIFTGAYPAIYDRDIHPTRYFKDYFDTYIKRDITELKNIHDMNTFVRFIRICASRAGQLLNYNDLARDTGVSHTTCRQWLSLLEASYIIFMLPPFFNNYSKRIIKSPKLYFYDTGLLCYLLNYKENSLSPMERSWGHLFENFIVAEMQKQIAHKNLFRTLYFWRDSHGNEVDVLFIENGKINIFEIKASTTVSSTMFKSLDYFTKLADPNEVNRYLIYGGDTSQNRSNYAVLPWHTISI